MWSMRNHQAWTKKWKPPVVVSIVSYNSQIKHTLIIIKCNVQLSYLKSRQYRLSKTNNQPCLDLQWFGNHNLVIVSGIFPPKTEKNQLCTFVDFFSGRCKECQLTYAKTYIPFVLKKTLYSQSTTLKCIFAILSWRSHLLFLVCYVNR